MAKRRGNNEGSIYKRSNGRWQAQVTIGGNRLAKTFGTHGECRDWIKEITSQIDRGLSFTNSNTTLGTYLDKWIIDVKPSLKIKSWYQYEGIVRNHIQPTLGKIKLRDLKPQSIQNLYSQKIDQGIGIRTVELIHAVLRRSLGMAQKQGMLANNPCLSVDKPKIDRREMSVLDENQVRILIDAVKDSSYAALLHLAVTTGMRQGELLGLKWQDLNWESEELHVIRQMQYLPGNGYRYSSPKTKAGTRQIKLGSQTIKSLVDHVEIQKAMRQYAGERWQDHDLIFTSEIGTPLGQKTLYRNFKRILREVGLPNIRFHDLRHTAATLMLLNGVSILVVSRRLGHAKISTTLDIYGHFIPGMQDEAAAIMDDLVAPVAADLQQ